MNRIILYDASSDEWLRFEDPIEILVAHQTADVTGVLARAHEATRAGHYAAGFVSYEAAPAFDRSLTTRAPAGFPPAWFGVYSRPVRHLLDRPARHCECRMQWTPSVDAHRYRSNVAEIRRQIHAGNTYQVNYSYRLRSMDPVDPWVLFLRMIAGQAATYGAFIETNDFAICSASPELFFRLDNKTLVSKPMKGTAARGLAYADDLAGAEELKSSPKARAENVMIVDMVRNDMGRIAVPGTVKVPRLFETERYPTLWQLTSTVQCQTDAALPEVFQALFPCASITGAPKARTMQLISNLESSPRQIYTGAIGYAGPQNTAQFNVAIRTALHDKTTGMSEYGVGGGIVWDSVDKSEFEECATKALILGQPLPEFSLLETILWTRDHGYFLRDRHLNRLRHSAEYFGFALDAELVQGKLDKLEESFVQDNYKVRLTVDRSGYTKLQSEILSEAKDPAPVTVRLAPFPVSRDDVFLYHKTTRRHTYNAAMAAVPGFDDVVLWNEKGQVTETCICNIVVRKNGRMITPPIGCGLLAGTYRQWMLDQGMIEEAIVKCSDLTGSNEVFLINSVRGSRKASVHGA